MIDWYDRVLGIALKLEGLRPANTSHGMMDVVDLLDSLFETVRPKVVLIGDSLKSQFMMWWMELGHKVLHIILVKTAKVLAIPYLFVEAQDKILRVPEMRDQMKSKNSTVSFWQLRWFSASHRCRACRCWAAKFFLSNRCTMQDDTVDHEDSTLE